MDRQAWIDERRAAVMADYDAEAATYDQNPYPNEVQQAWVRRLLATCPPGGTVLDAPCGTGRYFPLVAESGRRVVGIDQSAGMLDQARARGIAIELQHVGLQELAFVARFDAVMTIDAMENVAPEHWPLVLANLHRAHATTRPPLSDGRGARPASTSTRPTPSSSPAASRQYPVKS